MLPSKVNVFAKGLSCKLRTKRREKQTSELPTFTDEIVDLEVLLSTPHTQEEWVDGLSKYDEHILTSGDWLNDKLVNAAQNLILQGHPHVCGFQNTNLGLTLAFN